ncbi:hypothetical protein K1T71_008026 [Dendrolimus kikuchii]|uniref:Uncharacterized protein n=1 Tax=Dendrolimus kikuchii TaxID=765133 RepID=A0ACC1CZX6_9NEOP|nr:hypothetical protein K1T71_008026 [Dendrolimus kikuchii]
MKYLGLVLDSRWDFSAHFRQLLPRLKGAAGALSRLLPNVGGPNATCRKLFEGIVLTGHGCFGRYLCRLGREATSGCHHCDTGDEDTALHTLQECPAWTEQRRELVAHTGFDTSLPAVVRTMVGSSTG